MVGNIIRTCAIALVSSSFLCQASTGPELGCYFYEFPSKINKVKAQLEIKSENVMEFSVAFDAPKLNLPSNTIVCENEPFRYDAATSSMIVGEGDLSPCLQTLKSYTRGVVKTPLTINWIPTEKVLATTIVIPLRIPKTPNCVQFVTPSPSVEPSTDSTTTATVTPVVSSSASVDKNTDNPRADTTTPSTTTKSSATVPFIATYALLASILFVAGI